VLYLVTKNCERVDVETPYSTGTNTRQKVFVHALRLLNKLLPNYEVCSGYSSIIHSIYITCTVQRFKHILISLLLGSLNR
jgi:hypothetical protein